MVEHSDLGTMATISRFKAIASTGRVRASGFPAWLLWLAVHLFAITGFKNRGAVLSNWAIAFLGPGRPQRAIHMQQVSPRHACESRAAVIGPPVSSQPASGLPTS